LFAINCKTETGEDARVAVNGVQAHAVRHGQAFLLTNILETAK
jgi:hypothetical protein